jgi:YHS domain-containing protein
MALLDKNKTYVDPVCGMDVRPETAAASTCYNGIQIYFCAEGCRKAFEAAPQQYTLEHRKGFWRRYLERLNKATGGRPPACH